MEPVTTTQVLFGLDGVRVGDVVRVPGRSARCVVDGDAAGVVSHCLAEHGQDDSLASSDSGSTLLFACLLVRGERDAHLYCLAIAHLDLCLRLAAPQGGAQRVYSGRHPGKCPPP